MATSVDLNGLPELLTKLENLSFDMKKRGGRFALRKAAQVIREQVKANAIAKNLDDPATGRSIVKNVAERWNGKLFKRTGDLGFRVGILQGAVLPKKGEEPNLSAGAKTPHFRLLEFGTEKMAARPFMRPALSQSAQAAANTFIAQYKKSIDRALKKKSKES